MVWTCVKLFVFFLHEKDYCFRNVFYTNVRTKYMYYDCSVTSKYRVVISQLFYRHANLWLD